MRLDDESEKLQPIDLDDLAKKVRRSICSSIRAVSIGTRIPITNEHFSRMNAPQVGDLVAELTTNGMKNRPDIDAVGILEAVEWERVVFSDPDFVWDEIEEGKPHPTERVHYIRTFDGRRFRWTNASFAAAVAE